MFSSEKKEQAYKPDRYGYVPVKVPEFVADENPPQVKIHETTGLKDLQDVLEEAAENDRIWCGKVKFVFWALLGLILIGGVIALSVLMVVVQENKSPTGTVPQPLGVTGTTSGSGSSSSTSSSSTSSSSSSSNNANTPPSPPPPPPSDENGQLKIMSNPPFTPPAGYTALWWDEFDGTSLNTNFWNFDTGYGAQYGLWEWGNQEQEYYTTNPANVNVSNGYLYITALQEDTVLPDGFTFHYTSGRINSKGKVAFFGGMNTSDGRQWNNIRIESSLKAPQASKFDFFLFFVLSFQRVS